MSRFRSLGWEERGRRTIRLANFDYRQPAAYFVTICTHERTLLFSDTAYQTIAEDEWGISALRRPEIELDAFVVMPNHVHGIAWIVATDVGAQRAAPLPESPAQPAPRSDGPSAVRRFGAQRAAPLPEPDDRSAPGERPGVAARSLGAFVRGYKSAVTRAINIRRGTPNAPVWQRNYYEHVIRGEIALDRIRRYIEDNPRRWGFDRENPSALPDALEKDFWASLA